MTLPSCPLLFSKALLNELPTGILYVYSPYVNITQRSVRYLPRCLSHATSLFVGRLHHGLSSALPLYPIVHFFVDHSTTCFIICFVILFLSFTVGCVIISKICCWLCWLYHLLYYLPLYMPFPCLQLQQCPYRSGLHAPDPRIALDIWEHYDFTQGVRKLLTL